MVLPPVASEQAIRWRLLVVVLEAHWPLLVVAPVQVGSLVELPAPLLPVQVLRPHPALVLRPEPPPGRSAAAAR